MTDFKKMESETFLDYAERLMNGREEGIYDLDKVDIYKLLYGEDVSSDHARKALKVLKLTIKAASTCNIEGGACESEDIKKSYKDTTEIFQDGSRGSNRLLEISEEESKDDEFLLKKHGFDIRKYEIVSAKNSMWGSYNTDSGKKCLYSSKITVKPRKDSISMQEVQEHFAEFSKSYKSPVHVEIKQNKSGKMLELNIADLHIGKLSWIGDSGENYDYKIAKERFFYILNDILTRTKHIDFEKVLFIWSNDLFHFDSIETTTTGGTKLESDLRWQKLYRVGVEMLIEGIDIIASVTKAPIETFYIGSNHDKMTSFYAIGELSAWYRNTPNINIDIRPLSRKYTEWGKSLIGFIHGSGISKKNLGGLLPKEAGEQWGRTLFHEIHAAHFHSEQQVEEYNGTIVRYMSSPTSTDNWHYENGFTGTVKKSQCFIWDKEIGLTDILHTNII